jgi:hypothetical protein
VRSPEFKPQYCQEKKKEKRFYSKLQTDIWDYTQVEHRLRYLQLPYIMVDWSHKCI